MNDLVRESLYYGTGYAESVLFLIIGIGSIYTIKGTAKKAVFQGITITAAAIVSGFLLNIAVTNAFLHLQKSMDAMDADSGFIPLIFAVLTSLMVFLDVFPSVFAVVAVLWIFQGKGRTKIFVSVLLLLVVSSLSSFCAEMTCKYFFQWKDAFMGTSLEWLSRRIINTGWLMVTYVFYYRYGRKILKQLLKIAEEQIRNIVILPAVSYVVFQIVKSTMSTYSITIDSPEPGNFLLAVIMQVSIIVMYVLMYWAIFKSITVSAGAAQIKAELDVASKIQMSALPNHFPAFPEHKEIDIYAVMHPAKEVGGDFYDFFFIDKDRLAVLIADVSGKGVPAALFMMSGRTMIHNQVLLGRKPGEIFNNVNNQLENNNEEGMFITAFLGVLNVRTGELQYSNAGHNTPYLVQENGSVAMIDTTHGFVLGGILDMQFETEQCILNPGDTFILYTDGVTEAVNTKVEMYLEERLEQSLQKSRGKSVKETVEAIVDSVQAFSHGAQQSDDITILAVSRTQGEE